jgi:hypothetical protein
VLNTLHLIGISTEMHENTMSTLQQLRSQYDALVLDAKALADQSSGSLLPRYTNQHPIFDLPLIANLPQLKQRSPKRCKGKKLCVGSALTLSAPTTVSHPHTNPYPAMSTTAHRMGEERGSSSYSVVGAGFACAGKGSRELALSCLKDSVGDEREER